jgi:hypothetical protein
MQIEVESKVVGKVANTKFCRFVEFVQSPFENRIKDLVAMCYNG